MQRIVLAVVLLQGCYLGRNATARHVAMAIDGTLAVGGLVMRATPDEPNCFCLITNADVGMLPLVAGLVGLAINMVITPDEPAPAPKPAPPIERDPPTAACFGAHRVLGGELVTICAPSVQACEDQRAAKANNPAFTNVTAACEVYRASDRR